MVIMPAMQVGSIGGIKGNQTSGWGREGNWCVIRSSLILETVGLRPLFPFIYLPSGHFSSD